MTLEKRLQGIEYRLAMLEEGLREPEPSPVPVPRRIIETVAVVFNLKPSDITGPKRPLRFCGPRGLVMSIFRERLRMSLEEIGMHLGNRNYGTIHSGLESFQDRVETEPAFKRQCELGIEEVNKYLTEEA